MTITQHDQVQVRENKGYLTLQIPSLYAKIYYDRKQKYISFGAKPTQENMALAYQAAAELQKDLEEGTFHPQYELKYKHSNKQRKKGYELVSHNLLELYDLFIDKTKRQGKKSGNQYLSITGEKLYRGLHRNAIKSLPQGFLTKEEQEQIAEFLEKSKKPHTRAVTLRILYNLIAWAIDQAIIPKNTPNYFRDFQKEVPPAEKLGCPKLLQGLETFRDPEKIAWTEQERDLIIDAIKARQTTSRYYKECDVLGLLIEFLFQTGMRHGEAFALRWDRIRITDQGIRCVIDLSYSTKYKVTKGTKTEKTRTIWLTKRAGEIIYTLKHFYESKGRECKGNQLVFQKESGKGYITNEIASVWYYHTSQNILTGVGKLVAEGKLPQYLKPYSTRPTFTSLQAQSGVDAKTVATYIGDAVETIYEHYYQSNRVDGAIKV